MKTIDIEVPKNQISRLGDVTYAHVRAKNLPELPLGGNPRAQNLRSRVAKQIEEGLTEHPETFHLLNRGITITAKTTDYDPKTGLLHLLLNDQGGVIDGGHTLAILRRHTESDALVRLEIIEGQRNLTRDLARSRNTSQQVKEQSLANLSGRFQWIKDALKPEPFADSIAYRENELKPIDVREIIALITLFHPQFQSVDNPPLMGYSSKKRCLEMFLDPDYEAGYKFLTPLIGTILKLSDYIEFRFPEIYENSGGYSALMGERAKVRLGKVVEVRKVEAGFTLHYLEQSAYWRFPLGWTTPILAALRGSLDYQTGNWKANPYELFDKLGKKLVLATLETSRESGRGSPNAVGKNLEHWKKLHTIVLKELK